MRTYLLRCRDAEGHVFVAEEEGVVVGFVAVLSRERFTELDEPPGHHALITDLAVLEADRGRGFGRQLLQRAEMVVGYAGASELSIGVLAENNVAQCLYLDAAFVPYLEVFVELW